MEGEFDFAFIAQDIVVGNPEAGYTGPEWPWEVAERMEEAIIDDLIECTKSDIGNECKKNVEGSKEGDEIW